MVKLALPDFVKAIASMFKEVVTERVMGAIAKGKEFAAALGGFVSGGVTTAEPALAHARAPTNRSGPSR